MIICSNCLTVIRCIEVLLYEVPRPEVYEGDLVSDEIDQHILRLDVPVDDSLLLAVDNDTDELLEVETGSILLQIFLVRDDLEQVFVEERPFHDEEKTIVVFTNVVI